MKMLKKLMAVALAGVMAMAMFTACSMDDMTGKESSDLMQNSVFSSSAKVSYTDSGLGPVTAGNGSLFTFAECVNQGITYIKIENDYYRLVKSSKEATKLSEGDSYYAQAKKIIKIADDVVNVSDKISTAAHPDDKTFVIGNVTYKFDEKSNLTYLAYNGVELPDAKAEKLGSGTKVSYENDKVTKITCQGTEYTVQ